jgi:hypothetical protein
MNKKEIKIFGLFLATMGAILAVSLGGITGFSIVDMAQHSGILLFPMVLFIGGILIALAGDDLQSWLERKERESPSSSLEGAVQTLGEAKEFRKRYSGNAPFFKRMFGGKVERVMQDEKKYSSGENYQEEPGLNAELKMKREIERRRDLTNITQKGMQEYGRARKVIADGLRRLGIKHIEKEEGDYISERSIDNFTSQLDAKAKELGIPFSSSRYVALLKSKLPGYYQANLDAASKELIAYLENNSERVNTKELGQKINKMVKVITLSKTDASRLGNVPLNEDDAFRYYKEHARTLPISEFGRQEGLTLVHGVPYKSEREFLNNAQLHNGQGASLSYLNFLKETLGNNFMLSASAVDKNSNRYREFFSPIGIVIGEGKIYDASSRDVASQSKKGARVAFFNVGSNTEGSVEARAREARRNPNGKWNEYVVGDIKPRGIYFIRERIEQLKKSRSSSADENKTPEQTIRDLADFAKGQDLPLYEFREGEGFVQIPDVGKYLKPYKTSPSYVPRK